MYATFLDFFTARGGERRRATKAAKLLMLADMAVGEKDLVRASQLYEAAIRCKPDDPLPHYKLANALKDQGQLDAALDEFDRAVALDPKYANAHCNRGVVLQRLNRFEEALASYAQTVALHPEDALAHYNAGTLLRELQRPEAALASFARAIAASPTYAAAFYNRGMLLQEQGEWDAALADYDRALTIDPRFAQCHVARGNLRRERKELEMAVADFDRAIEIDDKYVAAYCNRGATLDQLQRHEAAIQNFDVAIGIDPSFAQAHSNRGDSLLRMNQFSAAIGSYDRAIAARPDFAEAHINRGDALLCLKQFTAAVASYDRAIAIEPERRFAVGMRRHARMHLCDWNGLEADADTLTAAIVSESAHERPFIIVALLDSPPVHREAARIWTDQHSPVDLSLPSTPRRAGTGKIRLGYFSSDFCEHPVATLAAQFLELHDRSRYEVMAFSFGPDTQDAMRRRLRKTFDEFFDVRASSDREVALLARSQGIDIAIDLNGHTAGSRTGIFALRAAPVQINFLGYPGTMGAEYIDYLVADATVIPQECREHYSEKILYLPDSFLPHDSGRVIAAHRFTREELGLPPDAMVYCCFNSSYKILPETFDSWMRILSRVEESVLWLSLNDATAAQNLRREAQSRGVDPGRLIFAERMPAAAEHLARLRVADLFLDTLPYNAHATALDALWSGLPLLTRIGQGFAGRVAASLLNAVGLPQLITSTAAQYEELAVELAHEPQRLAGIRLKLERNRLTAPLFDTARYTRNLEAAYARVHARHQAGSSPDHVGSA